MQMNSTLYSESEDGKCYGENEKVEGRVRRTRNAGIGGMGCEASRGPVGKVK